MCGLLMFGSVTLSAQKHRPFNPGQFESKLEQFITKYACLTPDEASRFFPLYHKMRREQFSYFNVNLRSKFIDKTDDKECEKIIRARDYNEIEVKKIQQRYHDEFFKILTPSKVFKILEAEDKFHRELFMDGKRSRHMRHEEK